MSWPAELLARIARCTDGELLKLIRTLTEDQLADLAREAPRRTLASLDGLCCVQERYPELRPVYPVSPTVERIIVMRRAESQAGVKG